MWQMCLHTSFMGKEGFETMGCLGVTKAGLSGLLGKYVIHPASRGVAAHTAGLFRSVRGAKGGFPPWGLPKLRIFTSPPVGAPQAREFSLFPLPKLGNFHFSPPWGLPKLGNFHFSPPWGLPKLGNFHFSPPWGLPKLGNFHFSPPWGLPKLGNFHCSPP